MKYSILSMKVTVCQAHELADGELRQVRVGNTPVLLVNYDGEIRAMGGVLFSLWGTSRPGTGPRRSAGLPVAHGSF